MDNVIECSKCDNKLDKTAPIKLIKDGKNYKVFCQDCTIFKYNTIYQSLIYMQKQTNEMKMLFESDFNLFNDNDITDDIRLYYNNIMSNFRDISCNIRSLKGCII